MTVHCDSSSLSILLPSKEVIRMKLLVYIPIKLWMIWMYVCMDGWMYGCMDVWMYVCMDVCMDVWMDGWMDG